MHDAADLPAGHARIPAAAARASPAKESPADIFAGLASDDVQLVLSACQSLREVRTSHVGVSPARDDLRSDVILSLQAVANASNASLGTLSKGILPRLPACVRHSSNADVHQELLALLVLLVRDIEVTSPARPTCAHSPNLRALARPPTNLLREGGLVVPWR